MIHENEFTDRHGRKHIIYSSCPVDEYELQSFLDKECRRIFREADEHWGGCVRLYKGHLAPLLDGHGEKIYELMDIAQDAWNKAKEAHKTLDYTNAYKERSIITDAFEKLVDLLRGSIFRPLQRVDPSDI